MKPKYTFQVLSRGSLSADDFKVLVLLYQPIMGMAAHSMYLSLYHLLNRQNFQSEGYTHQFLFDLLNVKEAQALKARQQLEALNLLDVYQKETHYIYQLKLPLSPGQFLQDTIFGEFLLSEVGEKIYHQLTENFKVEKVGLEGFKQVTKNFDDLYEFTPVGTKDNQMYLGKRPNGGSTIEASFDYDLFVSKLPDRVKKPILLSWKTQDHIQKLVFIYQLTIEDMVDIYLKTVLPNGDIELNQLNLKARILYQNKLQAKPIVQEKLTDDKDKAIHHLKNVSPQRIIQMYCKTDYQAMATDTVMALMTRNQVEVGLINALLLHVLKYKEGQLPHITYLEKVLESWLKKGIQTTEDAHKFILMDDKPQTTQTGKSNKTVKKHPQWVEDYLKELEDMEG